MNGIIKWLKDKRDNILIPNTLTTAVFNAEGKNVDELLDDKVSKEAGKGLFSGSYDDLTDVPTLVAGENITIKDNRYNTNDAVSNTIEISSSVNNALISDTINGNKNITTENSTDGNILYLNNAGYANQEKPVFDGKVTTTTNGIKNTNPIPCKKGDSITVTVSTGLGAITVYNANNEPLLAIPQLSEPPSKTETFTIDVDVTGIIIDVETTATTMEIKVNGSAYVTPSPDAPIHIGASADKGYFDGELVQGAYTDNGTINSNSVAVSSKNHIECVGGDVIALTYEKVITRSSGGVYPFYIRFYDIDKNFISRVNSDNSTNNIVVTAPTNAKSFLFTIAQDTDITPSTAKHICVTINGQYAVRIKTTNEEGTQYTEALIPVSAPLYDGDYIEVYADGSGREYRKMGSVVLDGVDKKFSRKSGSTDNNHLYGIDVSDCLVVSDVYSIDGELYCSVANHISNNELYFNDIVGISFGNTSNGFNISFGSDSNLTTLELANTWLQSNHVTVVYELATPTSTPLTAEQVAEFLKLRTYKGVTHVTADGEVTVRYYCDNASGETVEMLSREVDVIKNTVSDSCTVEHFDSSGKRSAIQFIRRPVLNSSYDGDYRFDVYVDYEASNSDDRVSYIVKNHPFPFEMWNGDEFGTDDNGDQYYLLRINRYKYFTTEQLTYAQVDRYYVTGENAGAVRITINPSLTRVKDFLSDYNMSGTYDVGVGYGQAIGVYNKKPLYQHVIEFGNLPNSTSKSIKYAKNDITGKPILGGTVNEVFIDYTHSYVIMDNNRYALNNEFWTCYINNTNVTITTKDDYTSVTAYITIQYTLKD